MKSTAQIVGKIHTCQQPTRSARF